MEKVSTISASYEFMNIYGMCSFDPPNLKRVSHNKAEPLICHFSKISSPAHDNAADCLKVVSVGGILNPLMSSRVQHGELDLTHCQDLDYHRAADEFHRLDSRSKIRARRVNEVHLGQTLSSMENGFVFTVRQDLHTLGCAYRQMVAMVELLHLSIIHFLHS